MFSTFNRLRDRLQGKVDPTLGPDEEETTHALTWMTPPRKGTMPSIRNGHTADVIDSRLFIFGGGDKAELLADLYVYDVREQSWSCPPCTGVAPPPRSRHCSAVIERSLYIWGGIGGGIDVHILDTLAMDWTTPDVVGTVPDSRFGHTCVAVDPSSAPRLIVLGGHNSRQALSDTHVLDISDNSLRWTKPHILGEAPICGNRHASVLIDDHAQPLLACVLVFAADMHDTFQTLYALRFRDGLQGNGYRWVPVPTAGRAPLSRARPSLALLDEHVFIICGVAAGKPLSTVAMLNVTTYTWSLPTIDGVPPPARMGATASRVGTDLLIFGGSDGKTSLRDLNVLVYVTWFTPSYSGRQPPPRVGHTLTFCGSKLYMLGGACGGTAYNDLFVLDPTAQLWSRPPMYGAPPDSLVGHSAVAVGTELIIWGGGDGRRAHAGLNVVDTATMLWSRPTTAGSEPLAHVGHSAVHADGKMFVFGGYGQRQYWNELVVLDTGIMVWIRPHTSGLPPMPCCLHTANLIWSSTGWVMVVYGGAFDETPIDQIVALDITSMRWTNIGNLAWDGPRPEPRFGHAAATIGPRLFIFGGTTGGVPDSWYSYCMGTGFVTGYEGGALNDLCVLDLQSRTFSDPKYGGQRPPPTYRIAGAAFRGKLFLYGGVGSNGQVSLLDTGYHDADDVKRPQQGGGVAAAAAGGVMAGMVAAATQELFDAEAGSGGAGAGAVSSSGTALRASQETRGLDVGAASALVALLQELGLNKYARLFLRQEVDVESLLQLSDRDLKDMGLSAIGARRKLTAAIHRHKLQRSAKADGKVAADGSVPSVASASASASSSASASDSSAAYAAAASSTSAGVVAGEIFRGRYKMNGKTYLGGSARVVLGEDTKTGAPIAVKVHLSHAYYSREVKLLKHLRSEYVVDMLDTIDEDNGSHPCIILEGGTHSLAEILGQGQLSHVRSAVTTRPFPRSQPLQLDPETSRVAASPCQLPVPPFCNCSPKRLAGSTLALLNLPSSGRAQAGARAALPGGRLCPLEKPRARRPQAAERRHLRLTPRAQGHRPRVRAQGGRAHTVQADALLRRARARGRRVGDDAPRTAAFSRVSSSAARRRGRRRRGGWRGRRRG